MLGEAGIGKTRLTEAFAAAAAQAEIRVAWGRCTDAESPAYWPWRQLLRALHGSTSLGLTTDGTGGRDVLFATVANELEQVATVVGPMVLVLDDIHWADPSSLALLRFVVSVLPDLPAVLVLTARDDPLELSTAAAATQTFPRLLNFTDIQEFAPKWSTSLQNSSYKFTDTLVVDGRLLAAANSTLYELRPSNGDVIHWRNLTPVVEGGDGAETHLASDGNLVFAGGEGHVRATALDRWSEQAWERKLTGNHPVNVLYAQGRLFAGANGTVHELDPRTGRLLHSRDLTSSGGSEVRLATDGTTLFVGCYGWLSGLRLQDWTADPWATGMTGAQLYPVQLLYADGKLFAGSNGAVHQLDPATGRLMHSMDLSNTAGEEVRMSLSKDRQMLVVGCHGYLSGISLKDWSRFAWQSQMSGKYWKMVDVVAQYSSDEIYASSNGYVQRRAFPSGDVKNAMQLSWILGSGDYTPTLTYIGGNGTRPDLIVGMHGYVYCIPV